LKVFNTYVEIGPDGNVKGSYRKVSGFRSLRLVIRFADLAVTMLADSLI
jgi:hypothetical protein